MLTLILLCITQPNNDLFSKLDALYDRQIAQYLAEIDGAKKNQALYSKMKQQLAVIQKNYVLTIPMFDFNKGVVNGDLGNLGYHMEKTSKTLGNGPDGNPVKVSGYEKTLRPCKVRTVADNGGVILSFPPFSRGEQVIVKGLPKEMIVEDKVIHLDKFIMEYAGKFDGIRSYTCVGNEASYQAWQKYRAAKDKRK